jgi:hypothetical protein
MDKDTFIKIIRETNDWLGCGEGIDILYYWPEDEKPELRSIVEGVITDYYAEIEREMANASR